MTATDNIASFVLRFTQEMWQDTQGEPHLQWRGYIRHVQGDEEVRFTDFAEAVAFIQRYLTQLALEASPGRGSQYQGKVVRESFKLWKQFTTSYTDVMLRMLEQSIGQTEPLREYMDDALENALKAWQLPAQTDQEQVVEALTELQAQLRVLTDKVEHLEQAVTQKPDGDNPNEVD